MFIDGRLPFLRELSDVGRWPSRIVRVNTEAFGFSSCEKRLLVERSLDDFRLPTDYSEAAFLPVAVAIAYHKPKGEPWGRWVIMMVTFASERA